jgi:hypothetical protein
MEESTTNNEAPSSNEAPISNAPDSRFKLWSIFFVFNFIIVLAVGGAETEKTTDKAWALALSILSLIIMFATLGAHLHPIYRGIIAGSKIELGIIIVLLVFWVILVTIISSPTNGLAVYESGDVALGNMYYFSWLGFITSAVLLASFVESSFGISVQSLRAKSSTFLYWAALMMTSLIVMGTSADIYSSTCDVPNNMKPEPFCSRTVLAVAAGTSGTILSLVVLVLKIALGSAPFLMEVALTSGLFVFFAFEVYYVTDNDGPGAPLGNLYYFSWFCFLLTFGVGKTCYEDYIEAQDLVAQERMAQMPMPTLAHVDSGEDVEAKPRDGPPKVAQSQLSEEDVEL